MFLNEEKQFGNRIMMFSLSQDKYKWVFWMIDHYIEVKGNIAGKVARKATTTLRCCVKNAWQS